MTKQVLCLEALENLQKIYTCLKDYGLEQYVTFDLGMVQQLDYYSGAIFRGIVAGVGTPVLKGGRYDNLLGVFGSDKPATGFAIELHKLLEAALVQKVSFPGNGVDYLIGYTENFRSQALQKARQLREEGYFVLMDNSYNEMTVLKNAAIRNAKNVIFIKG
jgi:ATP phosphoribosyltransferase regulatory subunit